MKTLLRFLPYIVATVVWADTHYASQVGLPQYPYTNWATAASSIQEAVFAADDGDAVVVGNGQYHVTSQLVVTNAILLQSENGPTLTTIDGNFTTRCVLLSHTSATVRGFTITKGLVYDYGAGARVLGGMLFDCVVRSNTSTLGDHVGGGISVEGSGIVRNCRVEGNSALRGGGALVTGGGVLEDSIIIGNVAAPTFFVDNTHGGGVSVIGGTLRNCIIVQNTAKYGGGVYCTGNGLVDRCLISHNTGTYTGGIISYGGIIRNTLVVTNTAQYSAGMSCENTSVYNCTIVNNRASHDIGGIYCGDWCYVWNSIIYYNSSTGLANFGLTHGPRVAIRYSCTTPYVTLWEGNISAEPRFRSRERGDYRLSYDSPCLNLGSNVTTDIGPSDRDNAPRVIGSGIDMGAYEYWETATMPSYSNQIVYCNWFVVSGCTYQVQQTHTLLSGMWTNVGDSVSALTDKLTVSDTNDASISAYRLILVDE